MCQAADGENPTFLQPLCRGAPDGKETRPAAARAFGDFLQKQGVDFVRLFKVTCHFGQKLVETNADVNRKAQRITDFIFDSAGDTSDQNTTVRYRSYPKSIHQWKIFQLPVHICGRYS